MHTQEQIDQFEQIVRDLHSEGWTRDEIQSLVGQVILKISGEQTRHLMKGLAIT